MIFFITAGGTGGHIFPGLALYEELIRRGHVVLFVGSRADYGKFEYLERLGNRFVGFPVQQLYRKKIYRNIKGAYCLLASVRKARSLIRAMRPDLCIGFGGYASAPLLIACRRSHTPYCVAEQNAFPGRANRHFAKKAAALFLNFRQAMDLFSARARKRALITGNPVRPSFGSVSQAEALKRMGIDSSKFVLGITGGSQGARELNNALLSIVRRQKKVTVLWSCGRDNYEELEKDTAGMKDVHLFPFVDDMAAFLSASALVISRAGATSLSELAACKTPSILVPYPYAADDHQRRNARAWEEAGAAVVVTQGLNFSDRLEEVLDGLVNNRAALLDMRKAASRLYDPLTLSHMADIAEELAREAHAHDKKKIKPRQTEEAHD